MLSEREQIIRKGLRKEKRQRWIDIEDAIRGGSVEVVLEFWQLHWPIDKHDMTFIFGRDSRHLRRHIRIENHRNLHRGHPVSTGWGM